MKVGIVTQPLAGNYGGILQNWALQQVLKDLGHEPVTIDVGVKYPFWRYLLGYGNSLLHNAFGVNRPFPHQPYKGKSIPQLTGEFISRNITMTKPVIGYTPQLIEKYKFEALVVGSDQVWRPCYNSSIENMFLKFASGCTLRRRISYAASFGVDTWEFSTGETACCSELVKKFDAVSVRESSAVRMCKDYLGIQAVHVLDPTMLLSLDRYIKLSDPIKCEKKSYMAVYCLDLSIPFLEKVKEMAFRLNLAPKFFSVDSQLSLSVPQWLAMFRDASFVLTDSFHGIVFSVLFNKPFITLRNEKRGNARIDSLLLSLGLNNNCDDHFDWTKINDKLFAFREKSLCFLKESLS